MQSTRSCPLCEPDTKAVLWHDEQLRVIRVADDDYCGYLRVIWNAHVAEMSDLAAVERAHLMTAVMAAEQSLRECMQPDKINLASLGNMVPHLHWHVIARFKDDRHFPQPIWGAPQREARRTAPGRPGDEQLASAIDHAMRTVIAGQSGAVQ